MRDADLRQRERDSDDPEALKRARVRVGLCWKCGKNPPLLPETEPAAQAIATSMIITPGSEPARAGQMRMDLNSSTMEIFQIEDGACVPCGSWYRVESAPDLEPNSFRFYGLNQIAPAIRNDISRIVDF